MSRYPRPLTLLVVVVFVSVGSRAVFGLDAAKSFESSGDSSVEAGVDSVQSPENSENELVGKIAEPGPNAKSLVHEIELVENVENGKDTDVEDMPDVSEAKPFDDKTRSGNLDVYYGKSIEHHVYTSIKVFRIKYPRLVPQRHF
ncbi:hypothetical protein L798_05677 [Zootermopsis nevadensis]|uniref:Uncharacterized protein n=1 Tax=Zootermopsis nevadensis TaxID=136037 RepID=A0A067R944_ZOONE|nr:hypothetical protein L798_05677 [Zootermopsis nevadensis]